MSENPPPPWIYTVHLVIEVDAPHLRDPSFPVVAPGTRVTWRVRGSKREALALYEAALAGQWDFLSEYVAAVAVTASREGRGRCVRVRVNRSTPEMRRHRREEQRHAEHVAAARRSAVTARPRNAHVESRK